MAFIFSNDESEDANSEQPQRDAQHLFGQYFAVQLDNEDEDAKKGSIELCMCQQHISYPFLSLPTHYTPIYCDQQTDDDRYSAFNIAQKTICRMM